MTELAVHPPASRGPGGRSALGRELVRVLLRGQGWHRDTATPSPSPRPVLTTDLASCSRHSLLRAQIQKPLVSQLGWAVKGPFGYHPQPSQTQSQMGQSRDSQEPWFPQLLMTGQWGGSRVVQGRVWHRGTRWPWGWLLSGSLADTPWDSRWPGCPPGTPLAHGFPLASWDATCSEMPASPGG